MVQSIPLLIYLQYQYLP
ncbi:hypothetical protein LINGRAHAP2_LOCUS14763 [Linum grandiflorum]